MLFDKQTYINRRNELKQKIGNGIIVLFGNTNAPANYPNNAFMFRQDSSFLYYFGQNQEDLIGIIDVDNNKEYLLGNDVDIEDIIWTGFVPSIQDLADEVGVANTAPLKELKTILAPYLCGDKKNIHFLPPYRYDTMIELGDLLGIHPYKTREAASLSLIKAVVDMRSVKSDAEIAEIERAMAIGYKMHTTAMKLCKPGVTEKFIEGQIVGIAESYGAKVSFQSIVSMHGEIFHGTPSLRPLEAGRLMICDAGAETINNYCSDNTRTMPVSGKFTQKQRDIYSIVEACHDLVIEKSQPGMKWMDMHLDVCRLMTDRLKDLGLMRGNTEDAVQAGAHAMFLQHGLGHMMGMDVHDMEGLGQVYVGFDDEVRPSEQFGTNCLRCGRRVQPGFVLTDEPGIYFIPALIDKWKAEGMHKDFICYDKLEDYRDFGGIRLEDDILITPTGCRVLGEQIIPYHPDDVEAFMAEA
ncbi:MAG: Xaa-Pro aminopeptidase [Prevotellaceae bacterium]|nr:Xaa-Pro aminopeptidase [Prevotellaceae bacterium]